MKRFLILVLAVLMISGCSLKNEMVVVEQTFKETEDYVTAKVQAQNVIDKAREEFFAGIPSMADTYPAVVGDELSVDNWGVKEYIIGYAFEAYNTGDSTKLQNYLKEQGLDAKFQLIVKKYDLEKQQQILYTKPENLALQSVSTSFFDNYLTGDFFLCYGGGLSSSAKLLGVLIPGTWKHAGIMDTLAPDSSAPILSASDSTTSGFCVGYETKTKWSNEAAVSAYRVYGRTDSKARAGVDYAKQFVGKPYNIFASRTSDDSWYCSKVVYRAWLSQGINIEPTPWITDPWVTPTDLADDSDTYWIGGDQS